MQILLPIIGLTSSMGAVVIKMKEDIERSLGKLSAPNLSPTQAATAIGLCHYRRLSLL